jgi:murein DD-endopeptidase MepM/ murein hydrolase activator NlpD
MSALAAAAVLVTAPRTPSSVADADDDAHAVTYRPPVENAPVIDTFRPPATPYGPGNRGIEYGTRPGTPVTAAADGRVTFAGTVAGAHYVTVQHADRLRTTYGPLGTIAATTTAGGAVEQGETIGTAGRRLLFTARLGDQDAYLDPAILLAASGTDPGTGRVRLVPDRPLPGYARPPAWRPPGRPRHP